MTIFLKKYLVPLLCLASISYSTHATHDAVPTVQQGSSDAQEAFTVDRALSSWEKAILFAQGVANISSAVFLIALPTYIFYDSFKPRIKVTTLDNALAKKVAGALHEPSTFSEPVPYNQTNEGQKLLMRAVETTDADTIHNTPTTIDPHFITQQGSPLIVEACSMLSQGDNTKERIDKKISIIKTLVQKGAPINQYPIVTSAELIRHPQGITLLKELNNNQNLSVTQKINLSARYYGQPLIRVTSTTCADKEPLSIFEYFVRAGLCEIINARAHNAAPFNSQASRWTLQEYSDAMRYLLQAGAQPLHRFSYKKARIVLPDWVKTMLVHSASLVVGLGPEITNVLDQKWRGHRVANERDALQKLDSHIFKVLVDKKRLPSNPTTLDAIKYLRNKINADAIARNMPVAAYHDDLYETAAWYAYNAGKKGLWLDKKPCVSYTNVVIECKT